MPFLEKSGIHWACVGNHDFDFGVEKLEKLIERTHFPWLLSNVKCSSTGGMLSKTQEYKILEHEGYKIGLIGLAEFQWLESLNTLDTEDIIFEDFVDWAKRFVKFFKEENSDIDFIIALTHFRNQRDLLLGEQVPELDLILGGHDHQTVNYQPNNILIRKSGTDFREFSMIKLWKYEQDSSEFVDNLQGVLTPEHTEHHDSSGVVIKDISKIDSNFRTLITEFEKVEITSRFQNDEELHEYSVKLITALGEKLKVPIGYVDVDLEGTFTKIRHMETNLSNMMADMVSDATESDMTLINTGTYRLDRVVKSGFITMQTVMDLLPMLDYVITVKVPGDKLHKLLENGVSSYPAYEGKFPSISGCRFEFDPKKEPGQRIDINDIFIKNEVLDHSKTYI